MPRASIFRAGDPGAVTLAGRPAVTASASSRTLGEDSARLDAAQLRRIQQYLEVMSALEATTNDLLRARSERMSGARVVNADARSVWYRIPEPAGGCPALGPLALSWEDIFNASKRNLAELAALRPPRWTGGDDVLRWVRAIRFNVLLLQDATNIRPVFRWPNDIPGNAPANDYFPSSEEQRQGSTHTLFTGSDNGLVEGASYPGNNYSTGVEIPLALRTVLRELDARYGSSPETGQSFRNDLWITALDWDFTWAQLPRYVNPWQVLPGPYPGAIVDVNPAHYPGHAPAPSWARAITKHWDTLAPVKLTTYFSVFGGEGVAGVYFNPQRALDEYTAIARVFSGFDLPTMLFDAIGFYVFNHLPYWRNRGIVSLDDATIQGLQRNAASARMRQGLAPAGLVASIASSVNPIVGAVVGLLQEIGFSTLDALINGALESDQPRRLFLRNYPESCIGLEAGQLSLDAEEAAITGGLVSRADAAAAEAEAAEVEELEAEREALEQQRRARSTNVWIQVGGAAAVLVGIGLVARAMTGGRG